MPWRYSKATQRGNNVMVVLVDDSDPDNVQERHLNYGYDGSVTKAEFIAMVKREVKAWLQHLNASETEIDITDQVDPDAVTE